MIYRIIPIKPYHHTLYLFSCEEKDFKKKMKSVFGDVGGLDETWYSGIRGLAGFHTFIEDEKNGIRTYIIWIRPVKNKNSELFLTISHECLHCVFKLLPSIGIPMTEQSEEAYTYLHEHLTNEVIRAMWGRD